ncbi:RsmG family class I SAM-dependent methyltransferase, partial [Bacillus altitudinis]|uniref:RsmG family class I SAM-dependent methyltransferase n=1 Tax=Bacillus altitudinis TaxID=293387 RepID=UPI0011A9226F
LLQSNHNINLTSITQNQQLYLNHFYHSISPPFFIHFHNLTTISHIPPPPPFPTIPLKISFPHLHLTILHSLHKPITFLNQLPKALNLQHTTFYHHPPETFPQPKHQPQTYHLLTPTPLPPLSLFTQLSLPLLKNQPFFLPLKPSPPHQHIQPPKKPLTLLPPHLLQNHSFLLPLQQTQPNIIVIQNKKQTPKK